MNSVNGIRMAIESLRGYSNPIRRWDGNAIDSHPTDRSESIAIRIPSHIITIPDYCHPDPIPPAGEFPMAEFWEAQPIPEAWGARVVGERILRPVDDFFDDHVSL